MKKRFMGISNTIEEMHTTEGSGYISAHLMGRKVGIRIYGFVNKDGKEEFTIARTSGLSNGYATTITTITEGDRK
mgnify:CR=1 FL=1